MLYLGTSQQGNLLLFLYEENRGRKETPGEVEDKLSLMLDLQKQQEKEWCSTGSCDLSRKYFFLASFAIHYL